MCRVGYLLVAHQVMLPRERTKRKQPVCQFRQQSHEQSLPMLLLQSGNLSDHPCGMMQVTLECSHGTGLSEKSVSRKYVLLAFEARKRTAVLKAALEQAARCVYPKRPNQGVILF